MSEPAAAIEAGGWQRLPAWLRPRSAEQPGTGRMRLIETTILVLVGLLLSVATVNDLVRQRHVNERLIADLSTWRHYTGHNYKNVAVDQQLLGVGSKHEVACGNTSPGAPHSRTQICLVIWGPTIGGRRTVHGGWYLRAGTEDDVRAERFGCFGAAGRGACPP